jgi:hypothetical protein
MEDNSSVRSSLKQKMGYSQYTNNFKTGKTIWLFMKIAWIGKDIFLFVFGKYSFLLDKVYILD